MKRLYLMRHATAGASDLPERSADEDPPLTPEAEGIRCVGQGPQLDDLISHLLDCRFRITALKKAAVACLERHSISPPRGLLLWLYPPKVLRRSGK